MGKTALQMALLLLLLVIASLAGAGCSSPQPEHTVAMAAANSMPVEIAGEPRRVLEAYRFAAANPDVLSRIPCYCGCGPMGHTSNYDCFWQADGTVERHATGCGICVDIAQDVRQALGQGRSLTEIRAQIDGDYSRFGPSTDTPPVAALP